MQLVIITTKYVSLSNVTIATNGVNTVVMFPLRLKIKQILSKSQNLFGFIVNANKQVLVVRESGSEESDIRNTDLLILCSKQQRLNFITKVVYSIIYSAKTLHVGASTKINIYTCILKPLSTSTKRQYMADRCIVQKRYVNSIC